MWLVITIIVTLVLIGIYVLSAGFRGIIKSTAQLIWAVIKKIATTIGVPVFLVVIGILALGLALFLSILLLGYEFDWNWLLRPLFLFNFVMLLITIMVTKWRQGALIFLFFCTILLFAEADIVIFKSHLFWFGLYSLFCVSWLAFGIYTGRTTLAAGIFLIIVMMVGIIFAGYTHLDKERWEAKRDNFMAKRSVGTTNITLETGVLKNNWKFANIKERPDYELLVSDNNGNFVSPQFSITPGARVLVYTQKNPTLPEKVKDAFLGFPVYQVRSSNLKIKDIYWILAENIVLMDNRGKNGEIKKPSDNGNSSTTPATPKVDTTLVAIQKQGEWIEVDAALHKDMRIYVHASHKEIRGMFSWMVEDNSILLQPIYKHKKEGWWGFFQITAEPDDPNTRFFLQLPEAVAGDTVRYWIT